jgi:hypothetical protein
MHVRRGLSELALPNQVLSSAGGLPARTCHVWTLDPRAFLGGTQAGDCSANRCSRLVMF